MNRWLAGWTRRGGEARKRQCLLIGCRSSIRKTTPRQEHCSLAVAGRNRSSLAWQGDWRRRPAAPNRCAVSHCYNWLSDKTKILRRFEQLSVLGRNDSPSENREPDLEQHHSAECPCRPPRAHYHWIESFQRHCSGNWGSMTRQLHNPERPVYRKGVADLAREKCAIFQKSRTPFRFRQFSCRTR